MRPKKKMIRQFPEFGTGSQLLYQGNSSRINKNSHSKDSAVQRRKYLFSTNLKSDMGQCDSKLFMLWVRSLLLEKKIQYFCKIKSAN